MLLRDMLQVVVLMLMPILIGAIRIIVVWLMTAIMLAAIVWSMKAVLDLSQV